MHLIETRNISTMLFAVTLLTAVVALVFTGPAAAKSKRYTYEAPYCKEKQPDGSPNPCGAIVYAVATSNYYVNKVSVKARDEKNQNWDKNPNCLGLVTENTMDLRVSEYGVFIVPAPCSYKLVIHIGAGDTRDNHVFVSPGCQIVLESKGTTLNNNKPKVNKVSWSDDAKASFDAKGIDVPGTNVSDRYFHAAVGQAGTEHFCNKDDKADEAY